MKKIMFLMLCGISLIGVAQTKYVLIDESKLTVDGTSTVHDWTVTANKMSGKVLKGESFLEEITLEVEVAAILSERGATMDKKMHSALQKETHPHIRLVLKESKNESMLSGNLNIAGKTNQVEIFANIESSEDNLKISGNYGIALEDFDIEPPTAMFGQVIVGDVVTVNFELIFAQ